MPFLFEVLEVSFEATKFFFDSTYKKVGLGFFFPLYHFFLVSFSLVSEKFLICL